MLRKFKSHSSLSTQSNIPHPGNRLNFMWARLKVAVTVSLRMFRNNHLHLLDHPDNHDPPDLITGSSADFLPPSSSDSHSPEGRDEDEDEDDAGYIEPIILSPSLALILETGHSHIWADLMKPNWQRLPIDRGQNRRDLKSTEAILLKTE